MTKNPAPPVKIRITFTRHTLRCTVPATITRDERLAAAGHLRAMADEFERPWRKKSTNKRGRR